MIDPLNAFDTLSLEAFDIKKEVTVYSDKALNRWWTKAWFNNSKVGEWAIEISHQTAQDFINEKIDKEEMLERYFKDKMKIYHAAIEKTKNEILSLS